MRASRLVIGAAAGVGAASVALVVQAQPVADARVSLTWRAPGGCPDESSVRADVAQMLAGSRAAVSARADVTHLGDSWRVIVAMNGGERRLEARSCRALAEATALIVAMAVDPERVAANRPSASSAPRDGGASDAVPDARATEGAPVDAGLAEASAVDAERTASSLALPSHDHARRKRVRHRRVWRQDRLSGHDWNHREPAHDASDVDRNELLDERRKLPRRLGAPQHLLPVRGRRRADVRRVGR